jgi:hypothetical protein
LKWNIFFFGLVFLDKEKIDDKPEVLIEIKNKEGDVVKQIIKPLKKGLNRINWDLSTFNTTVVKASDNKGRSWRYGGAMYREVDPGIYEVSIFKRQGVSLSLLDGPVSLKVERLRSNVLTNPQTQSYLTLCLTPFLLISVQGLRSKKQQYELHLLHLQEDFE